jgi:cellulose biosynthesis protein BcsQ
MSYILDDDGGHRMVITIASGKGGSAKTKTTANLARALFDIGAPPSAMIDADYGISLTRLYGYSPTSSIVTALIEGTISFEDALHETNDEIPLIPGSPQVAKVPGTREELKRWTDRLREVGTDKLILIDTSDDITSAPVAAAILAADLLVIPLQFEDGDYERTYPEIEGILTHFGHKPEEVWVGSMVEGRTAYEKAVAQRLADEGREISIRIPRAVAVREAGRHERSAVGAFPKAKVSEVYRDLATVILARLRRLGYMGGKAAPVGRPTRDVTLGESVRI